MRVMTICYIAYATYLLTMAGINVYLGIVVHPAYLTASIWQIFGAIMWIFVMIIIKDLHDYRKVSLDIRKTYRGLIDAYEKERELLKQKIELLEANQKPQ